jgi:hypothetical protein
VLRTAEAISDLLRSICSEPFSEQLDLKQFHNSLPWIFEMVKVLLPQLGQEILTEFPSVGACFRI